MIGVFATRDTLASPAVVNIEPGTKAVIDSSEKPITDKTTNARGKITTDQAGTPPAVYRLMYTPPDDTNADLNETVRYDKDGATLEAPVHVIARPTPPAQPPVLGDAFKVLVVMFVLAVVLEQALSVLFNWRPFLRNFDGRGVKTVVSVFVAWLVIDTFKLDLIQQLINSLHSVDHVESGLPTKLLTALIVAGGSSGVNNVLVSLGFRSMRSAEQLAPRPPQDKAWIAVRLRRKSAKGQVIVSIGPQGETMPVVGTIDGSTIKSKLLQSIIVDRGRFPAFAGYPLNPEAGKRYVVRLSSQVENGQELTIEWGPHPVAAGAILDITLEL